MPDLSLVGSLAILLGRRLRLTKELINCACASLGVPLVHAVTAAFKDLR